MSNKPGNAFPRGVHSEENSVTSNQLEELIHSVLRLATSAKLCRSCGKPVRQQTDTDDRQLSFEELLQPPPASDFFQIGDRVVIFHLALFRYPLIESDAVVLGRVPGEAHEYFVLFPGEARPRRRFVLPGEFQRDPDRTLDALRAVWRAGLDGKAANDNGEC